MPPEGLESLESYLSSSLSSRKSVGVAPGMPLPTPGVLTQDPAPTTGESLGSHSVELESVLGRGGFATVWRGKWLLTTVAVKVFHESLSEKAISKFQLEAKTLRTLRHPNICYFLDTCMLHGAPVIVLELLNGGTLGQHLHLESVPTKHMSVLEPIDVAAAELDDDEGRGDTSSAESLVSRRPATETWSAVASSELLQLAKDVALGLHYLHSNGVTHRDVKHANVMTEHGQTVRAKLCDFGLSALKSTTHEHGAPRSFSSMGTVRYQAPETTQLMAASTSSRVPSDKLAVAHHARVDVYSYGLLLYEIMHGFIFFGGSVPLKVAIMASSGQRPPITLRPEHSSLSAVIARCWDAEAERRPNMRQVVEELSALEARRL